MTERPHRTGVAAPVRRLPRAGALLLSGALLLAAPGGAAAAAYFASPAGGVSGCADPATPCDLCSAIQAAGAGDQVFLAGGTYSAVCPPGPATLTLAKDLTLLGGWDGTVATPPRRDPAANQAILDGLSTRQVVRVAPGRSVTLDGLSVVNGFDGSSGGGIYSAGSDLTLRAVEVLNCAVDNAVADTYGGGIFFSGGDLLVRDSTIESNTASCTTCSGSYGGGIYLADPASALVEGSRLPLNTAWRGHGIFAEGTGAAAPLEVRRTLFTDNSGSGYGGGMELANVDAVLEDSVIRNNWAGSAAGALRQSLGSLTARRNRFEGNSSYSGAGLTLYGLATLTFENNILWGNTTSNTNPSYRVTGIYLSGLAPSSLAVRHNTVIGPAGATPGIGLRTELPAPATLTLENNIFSGFETAVSSFGPETVDLRGTLWWANLANTAVGGAGAVTSADEVTGDPAFLDPVAEDCHLGPASAARGAAVAFSGGPLGDDIDGVARDASPDIGADEYQAHVTVGAPNGREVLLAGGSARITWDGPAKAKTFDVFFSANRGKTWSRVERRASGRELDWTVPVSKRNVTGGLVKVVGRSAAGKLVGTDRSDRTFRVEVVRVTAPGGGGTVTGGVPTEIAWETNATSSPVAKVLAYYTLNGGKTWKRILPGPDLWNPGRLTWTPPAVGSPKTRCKVKVVLKNAAGAKVGIDASNGLFTIN